MTTASRNEGPNNSKPTTSRVTTRKKKGPNDARRVIWALFFSDCYTRRGGFTVLLALVTARGGRGVLGKKIVVSNKNMLVSLHNNHNHTNLWAKRR